MYRISDGSNAGAGRGASSPDRAETGDRAKSNLRSLAPPVAQALRISLPKIRSEAIEDAITQVESSGARSVVIEGGEDGFCAGLDLDVAGEVEVGDMVQALGRYGALLDSLRGFQGPVIAAVTGDALGGGLGLVGAADLVVASPDATFSLPETIVGLCPAVVLPFVADRIGTRRARLLAMGHRPLTAAEALSWGLVDEVTEDVQGAVKGHLKRFSRTDAKAAAVSKRLPAAVQERGEGIRMFAELISQTQTRKRIKRFMDGEAPWVEDVA